MKESQFSPWPYHRPTLIVHADWSVHHAKRRMAIAELDPDGGYTVSSIGPVGAVESFYARMAARSSQPALILAGFDFPIGIPAHYASLLGVTSFKELLPRLGKGDLGEFYQVARSPLEISPQRPFYPHGTKGVKHAHLLEGLQAPDLAALLRRCEHKTGSRTQACPLFWTLGANQVGRAAIAGWRDLLAPASEFTDLDVRLWPFDGTLKDLLHPGNFVVIETYPTEFYHQLGLALGKGGKGSGKRSQAARSSNAEALRAYASALSIRLIPEVEAFIVDGFGPREDGEDDFDALVGLLGMLGTLARGVEPQVGVSREAALVEGWIFGQAASG